MFPVFGQGDYPVQPVYAEDLAALAIMAGSQNVNTVADAAGPDTFTFEELLRLLAESVNALVRLVHTPPSLGCAMTRLVGLVLRDVVLTSDEVGGLMEGLLTSKHAPTGTTSVGVLLEDSADVLGRRYKSELWRNYRQQIGDV